MIVMAYCAYITTIKEILPHNNADRLKITHCFGNQCIIDLSYQVGDRVVYFPEGGQLDLDFCKNNNLIRIKNEDGTYSGGYMDENKRRITSVRLRGEASDGLVLPISCLSPYVDINELKDGDKIDVLNGVELCKKYIPKTNPRNNKNVSNGAKNVKNRVKKTSYPIFAEHADTNQLAYNLHNLHEGDLLTISLKMHGTSARYSNTIKEIIKEPNKFFKLFGIKPKIKTEWEVVGGTRRCVLENYDGGYYGNDKFREKYLNFLKDKLPKGMTVYGEIVGWVNDVTPIMGSCSNKALGKDFIKKYGETTVFDYGCEVGESDFYVYRITMTNEDGYTIELNTEQAQMEAEKLGLKFVPVFEIFRYTTVEDLMERVEKYYDGKDPIGNHIREGVVIKKENKDKFIAYKHKNFSFKVLSGIISENAVTEGLSDDMIDEMA